MNDQNEVLRSTETPFPSRRSARALTSAARPADARSGPKRGALPTAPLTRSQRNRRIRAAVTMGLIVPGIFGTIAIPAFAVPGQAAPSGVNAMLRGEVQSFTVSGSAVSPGVVRDGYAATTPEELAAAKAVAAAKAEAAARELSQAPTRGSGGGTRTVYNFDDSGLAAYLSGVPGGWQRPVDGPISSPYGPRAIVCNGSGCSNGFHSGVDFSDPCGTPVRAVSAGRVTFVGNAGAYGQRVIVDHGKGVESVYGHLQYRSFRVSVGDLVGGGTTVGGVGATGVVTGCHLDLKIQVGGAFTDPSAFLRAVGVSM